MKGLISVVGQNTAPAVVLECGPQRLSLHPLQVLRRERLRAHATMIEKLRIPPAKKSEPSIMGATARKGKSVSGDRLSQPLFDLAQVE
jgi:hypothetical protein